VIDGKPNIVVSVGKTLQKSYPAGTLVKSLAEVIGGRGGGKSDRAQAGGSDVEGLGKLKERLMKILC
jgi:alanyl-tRNA synthetase